MKKCLTKKTALTGVSGCLVEKPECGYAHKFGFSFECRHPDHTKFHVHTTDEIVELYDALRQKRRDEFAANLDEPGKRYFNLQADFHVQPLLTTDQNSACA